jgi:ABC-2 type transport system ATP-binding protein
VILTTHYMDEAEALADHVAILARGQIVAAGTPETIGGRDVGAATIRFRLPDDVAAGELPVPAICDDASAVEIHTDDDLRVLHALTGWARERNVRLLGLTVMRNTLEDVYLRLTSGERDKPEPEEVEKMAASR